MKASARSIDDLVYLPKPADVVKSGSVPLGIRERLKRLLDPNSSDKSVMQIRDLLLRKRVAPGEVVGLLGFTIWQVPREDGWFRFMRASEPGRAALGAEGMRAAIKRIIGVAAHIETRVLPTLDRCGSSHEERNGHVLVQTKAMEYAHVPVLLRNLAADCRLPTIKAQRHRPQDARIRTFAQMLSIIFKKRNPRSAPTEVEIFEDAAYVLSYVLAKRVSGESIAKAQQRARLEVRHLNKKRRRQPRRAV